MINSPKLIAILRVKNARPTLEACFSKLSKLVDGIVVVDNGSTDGTKSLYKNYPKILQVASTTGFDESTDRNLALNLARKWLPDWILWIDADEVFEKSATKAQLNNYMSRPGLSQVNFRLFHFWLSKTKFRADGIWGDYTARPQRMMFRNQPQAKFSTVKFHGGGITGVKGDTITSNIRLKHFGYISLSQISKKIARDRQQSRLHPHQASKNLPLSKATAPKLHTWRDFDSTPQGQISRYLNHFYWQARLALLNFKQLLVGKLSIYYQSPLVRNLELTLTIAWRTIAVKYKQSVLGILWTLIQPISLMLVFLVMSLILNLQSDGAPYPIFVYTGLLPWLFFNNAVKTVSNSLIDNAALIKKINLNQKIFALAALISSSVDFFISGLFLIVLMLVYSVSLSPALFILPLIFASQLGLIFGIGLTLSALSIFKRDLLYTLPTLLSLLLYVTPTFYPLSSVPDKIKTIYLFNPLAIIVDSFREIIIFHNSPSPYHLLYIFVSATAALVIGLKLFNHLEKYTADLL